LKNKYQSKETVIPAKAGIHKDDKLKLATILSIRPKIIFIKERKRELYQNIIPKKSETVTRNLLNCKEFKFLVASLVALSK